MKKSATKQIKTSELLRLLELSGFDVRLAHQKKMLKEAAKPGVMVRARAVVAAPVKIKGLILPDEYRILVNRDLELDERVKTVLHELIHLRSPEIGEQRTEKEAHRLYRQLTPNQLGRLEFLVS